MRRRLLWVGGSTLLFLTLLVFFLPQLASVFPGLTARLVSGFIPGTVRWESVSASWWGPCSVEKIQLDDPDKQLSLSADAISGVSGVWKLLWGGSLGHLEVQNVHVDVVRVPKAVSSGKASAGSNKAIQFFVHARPVQVLVNGQDVVQDGELTGDITLGETLSGTLKASGKAQSGSFEAQLTALNARLFLTNLAKPIEGELFGSIQAKEFSSQSLAALTSSAFADTLDASFDGAIDFTAKDGGLSAQGSARSGQILAFEAKLEHRGGLLRANFGELRCLVTPALLALMGVQADVQGAVTGQASLTVPVQESVLWESAELSAQLTGQDGSFEGSKLAANKMANGPFGFSVHTPRWQAEDMTLSQQGLSWVGSVPQVIYDGKTVAQDATMTHTAAATELMATVNLTAAPLPERFQSLARDCIRFDGSLRGDQFAIAASGPEDVQARVIGTIGNDTITLQPSTVLWVAEATIDAAQIPLQKDFLSGLSAKGRIKGPSGAISSVVGTDVSAFVGSTVDCGFNVSEGRAAVVLNQGEFYGQKLAGFGAEISLTELPKALNYKLSGPVAGQGRLETGNDGRMSLKPTVLTLQLAAPLYQTTKAVMIEARELSFATNGPSNMTASCRLTAPSFNSVLGTKDITADLLYDGARQQALVDLATEKIQARKVQLDLGQMKASIPSVSDYKQDLLSNVEASFLNALVSVRIPALNPGRLLTFTNPGDTRFSKAFLPAELFDVRATFDTKEKRLITQIKGDKASSFDGQLKLSEQNFVLEKPAKLRLSTENGPIEVDLDTLIVPLSTEVEQGQLNLQVKAPAQAVLPFIPKSFQSNMGQQVTAALYTQDGHILLDAESGACLIKGADFALPLRNQMTGPFVASASVQQISLGDIGASQVSAKVKLPFETAYTYADVASELAGLINSEPSARKLTPEITVSAASFSHPSLDRTLGSTASVQASAQGYPLQMKASVQGAGEEKRLLDVTATRGDHSYKVSAFTQSATQGSASCFFDLGYDAVSVFLNSPCVVQATSIAGVSSMFNIKMFRVPLDMNGLTDPRNQIQVSSDNFNVSVLGNLGLSQESWKRLFGTKLATNIVMMGGTLNGSFDSDALSSTSFSALFVPGVYSLTLKDLSRKEFKNEGISNVQAQLLWGNGKWNMSLSSSHANLKQPLMGTYTDSEIKITAPAELSVVLADSWRKLYDPTITVIASSPENLSIGILPQKIATQMDWEKGYLQCLSIRDVVIKPVRAKVSGVAPQIVQTALHFNQLQEMWLAPSTLSLIQGELSLSRLDTRMSQGFSSQAVLGKGVVAVAWGKLNFITGETNLRLCLPADVVIQGLNRPELYFSLPLRGNLQTQTFAQMLPSADVLGQVIAELTFQLLMPIPIPIQSDYVGQLSKWNASLPKAPAFPWAKPGEVSSTPSEPSTLTLPPIFNVLGEGLMNLGR